jgi:uncharacterized protein (DUF2267 family)
MASDQLEDMMSDVPALDTSVQRAHEWLHDIERELGFKNERAAYAALRATLHALRDRLPVELVAHFGAGLPTLVRGIYYDGWHPSAARLKAAHDDDLAGSMRHDLSGHDELPNAERVAAKVMRVIDKHMASGQIDHIFDAWPKQVRELWRDAWQGKGDR